MFSHSKRNKKLSPSRGVRQGRVGAPRGRRARLELLEDRRMLSITWVNRGSDSFDAVYGASATIARQIVDRAISDWNQLIIDFNYDGDGNAATDNKYSLTLNAGALQTTLRGTTTNFLITTASPTRRGGLPIAATITMDDNAGGPGWYFDPVPADDARFTAVVDTFQANFVDATTGNANYVDFYSVVAREIGHAVGLTTDSLTARIHFFLTPQGDDRVSSQPADTLMKFNAGAPSQTLFGITATFSTIEGGSLYEGPPDPNFPTAPTAVHDLMNASRTLAPGSANPIPTTRRFITDLDIKILNDAYEYIFSNFASNTNSARVSLDSQTGLLLVQGRPGAKNDTISLTLSGSNIIASVSGTGNVDPTSETIPMGEVSQIIIFGNRGADVITVSPSITVPNKQVNYVVSTNQDSADAGATLGDGIVDLDPNALGDQVALRAALRDANGTNLARGIYIPRGLYRLSLSGAEPSGTGDDTIGDLDVKRNLTIIGSGPGSTIIDASTLATRDRVFETGGNATFNLSGVTLTGGLTGRGGGGIHVNNNPASGAVELTLTDVAVVGNATDLSVGPANGLGGGLFVAPGATVDLSGCVFIKNQAPVGGGGAIFAAATASAAANVVIDSSTFAQNSPADSPDFRAQSSGGTTAKFTSAGGNQFTSTAGAQFLSPTDPTQADHVGTPDFVVTSIVDSFNHSDDASVLSLREAVDLATPAAQKQIWLPAWTFVLTRERQSPQAPNETDLSTGDMEITKLFNIRGSAIPGATRVFWKSGVVDAAFDLLGDADGNGRVDGADFFVWQQTLGQADDLRGDLDNNGAINGADLTAFKAHFGDAPVTNVAVPSTPPGKTTTLGGAVVAASADLVAAAKAPVSESVAASLGFNGSAPLSLLSMTELQTPVRSGKRGVRR